jgi:hypothetical protein
MQYRVQGRVDDLWQRGRRRVAVAAVGQAGVENFFSARPALKRGRQVYKQKLVYRMMVIVNGVPHLWISRVYSTGSGVYVPHKPVGCSCMCLVEKLDKNWDRGKSRRFAQSIPVDMQKLIHKA